MTSQTDNGKNWFPSPPPSLILEGPYPTPFYSGYLLFQTGLFLYQAPSKGLSQQFPKMGSHQEDQLTRVSQTKPKPQLFQPGYSYPRYRLFLFCLQSPAQSQTHLSSPDSSPTDQSSSELQTGRRKYLPVSAQPYQFPPAGPLSPGWCWKQSWQPNTGKRTPQRNHYPPSNQTQQTLATLTLQVWVQGIYWESFSCRSWWRVFGQSSFINLRFLRSKHVYPVSSFELNV